MDEDWGRPFDDGEWPVTAVRQLRLITPDGEIFRLEYTPQRPTETVLAASRYL